MSCATFNSIFFLFAILLLKNYFSTPMLWTYKTLMTDLWAGAYIDWGYNGTHPRLRRIYFKCKLRQNHTRYAADNQQIKFLALNVDSNSPRFDSLGSMSPPYGGVKFVYPLNQNARFLLPLLSRVSWALGQISCCKQTSYYKSIWNNIFNLKRHAHVFLE